jgi:hypothetical protein
LTDPLKGEFKIDFRAKKKKKKIAEPGRTYDSRQLPKQDRFHRVYVLWLG